MAHTAPQAARAAGLSRCPQLALSTGGGGPGGGTRVRLQPKAPQQRPPKWAEDLRGPEKAGDGEVAEGTLAGSGPTAELSPEDHCARAHRPFTSLSPKWKTRQRRKSVWQGGPLLRTVQTWRKRCPAPRQWRPGCTALSLPEGVPVRLKFWGAPSGGRCAGHSLGRRGRGRDEEGRGGLRS